MKARGRLVIMAKAPRVGRVKRRLAADIGAVPAAAFYRGATATVLRRLARDPRWQAELWVTPDRFARPGGPWQRHPVRRAQGPGDLGARMGRAVRAGGPGPVVVIGTDIPDIGPAQVARAFRALGRHDVVFGPAADGGYWLVGLRGRPRMPDLFRGVRWSTAHALGDTLANVPAGARVALLDELEDIDNGAALARWRHRRH